VLRRSRRLSVVGLGIALAVVTAGAALANVPIKIASLDPYTNTDSYHKTEVEPDTFSNGNTIVSTFQMGRHLDGGASNIGFATSTNGGGTWTDGGLPSLTTFSTPPGPYARSTDPAVAYDAKHAVWLIQTLNSLTNNGFNGDAITVSRSVNGTTWTAPVNVTTAGVSLDSTWIACDNFPASPAYGHCYSEYDDFGAGAFLHMATSVNGGLTWQQATVPSSTVIGGHPLGQPNGHVVVPITSNPISTIEAFVSADGGLTYSGPNNIAALQTHFIGGGLRALDVVSADVDANGKVYVVWYDCRFRSGCSSNDIVMSTSTNGTTWTAPMRIPIDPVSSTVDHFIPGIAVEPGTSGATAHLGLQYWYYDQANCSTCQLKVGFTESTNGGTSWSAAQQLGGPYGVTWYPNTTSGYMVGDYSSLSWVTNGWQLLWAAAKQTTCQLGANNCKVTMVAPKTPLVGAGPARPSTSRVATGAGLSPGTGLSSAR
jgi:hypothetical protein